MDKDKYVIRGYRFDTSKDAEEAKLEIEKAAYFEQRLLGRDAENILSIYDKVLDEKIFVTPIGWEYLKELQDELLESGIERDRIRPIPLYQTFYHRDIERTQNKGIAKERIHPSSRKKWTPSEKLRISTWLNVFLCALVLLMFVVTLRGENANAINYRRAIVNQYASWEQELSERESFIRQLEEEFGLK